MRSILIYILIASLLLLPNAMAEVEVIGPFKSGECFQLVQTCSNCTYVNLTKLEYYGSDSELIYIGKLMDNYGTDYNYSICNLTKTGNYVATTCGDVDGELTCVAYEFELTPSGYIQSTSQSIISLVLLLSLVFVAGLFVYIGKNLFEGEKTWFFGVLFFTLSIMLIIYTFSLSIVYARDLSYTSGTVGQQENIFRSLLMIVRYSMLFVLPFILWYGYDSWKYRKKEKESNDGWDNNQY